MKVIVRTLPRDPPGDRGFTCKGAKLQDFIRIRSQRQDNTRMPALQGNNTPSQHRQKTSCATKPSASFSKFSLLQGRELNNSSARTSSHGGLHLDTKSNTRVSNREGTNHRDPVHHSTTHGGISINNACRVTVLAKPRVVIQVNIGPHTAGGKRDKSRRVLG